MDKLDLSLDAIATSSVGEGGKRRSGRGGRGKRGGGAGRGRRRNVGDVYNPLSRDDTLTPDQATLPRGPVRRGRTLRPSPYAAVPQAYVRLFLDPPSSNSNAAGVL